MINNLKIQIKQAEANISYEKIHAKLQYFIIKKRFIKFLHSPSAIVLLFITGTVIGHQIKTQNQKLSSGNNDTTKDYTGSKHMSAFKNALYFFSDILAIANLTKDISYKLF